MAWNVFGGEYPGIIDKLVTIIKEKNYLVHVDLSCNSFSHKESKQIAEALNENHTIHGFHFRGNYGHVDSKGFLRIPENY